MGRNKMRLPAYMKTRKKQRIRNWFKSAVQNPLRFAMLQYLANYPLTHSVFPPKVKKPEEPTTLPPLPEVPESFSDIRVPRRQRRVILRRRVGRPKVSNKLINKPPLKKLGISRLEPIHMYSLRSRGARDKNKGQETKQ